MYSHSQIGSLVSYTINYMEKKSLPGAKSSKHDGEQAERHLDSDESDDNSMLVEKEEDSHSDIDTIEEEVDLSASEGSDHEEQNENDEKTMQSNQLQYLTKQNLLAFQQQASMQPYGIAQYLQQH